MAQDKDNGKTLQKSNISRYLKHIWTHVLIYTLVDTLTALIILVFVHGTIFLIYFVTRSYLNINIKYVIVSFFILTFLYMLSILIVSWWHHYLLIRYRQIQVERANTSQPKQNTPLETTK